MLGLRKDSHSTRLISPSPDVMNERQYTIDGAKGIGEERMTEQTKKCPYCAEEILFEAIKCKHCGEMLLKKEGPPEQSAGNSRMRTLGTFILIVGLAVGLYYWQLFDASVEAPGVGRVNNIGLLQDKQTGTFLGFGAVALGLILVLVGGNKQSISQQESERASMVQAPTTQEVPKSIITCPECKQSEGIPSNNLCDISQYKKYSVAVKSTFGFQTLILKCKSCGKQFKYDDIPFGSRTS
jgi:hypothetical protein